MLLCIGYALCYLSCAYTVYTYYVRIFMCQLYRQGELKRNQINRAHNPRNENKQRNKKTNAQQTKLKQQLNRRRLLTGYSLIRAMKCLFFFSLPKANALNEIDIRIYRP